MTKCTKCGQEIVKHLKEDKDNWIWIPELKVYIEKDVHHKDYSYDQLKEIYGKDFEKMLLTKSQVEFLRDHSNYSKIFKLKNSFTNDFFIQQFNEEDKKKGFVAVFFVYWDGSFFYSVWYSRYSYVYRGVRFCRKKISKSKQIKEVDNNGKMLNKIEGDEDEGVNEIGVNFFDDK